jgi:hypothetical protein
MNCLVIFTVACIAVGVCFVVVVVVFFEGEDFTQAIFTVIFLRDIDLFRKYLLLYLVTDNLTDNLTL